MASLAPQLELLEAAELAAAYASSRELVTARLAALKVPSADIDDLRQEVFLVALRKQPRLFDRDAAKAWLCKVCEYVALAHRRRAYRRHEVPGDLSETAAAPWVTLPEAERSEWAADRVHGALSRLNGRERELLALRVAADMPFRHLAELHECDVKTVRKRFQSAVRRLQHQLVIEDTAELSTASDHQPRSSWRSRRDLFDAAPVRGASRGVALGAFERTLIVSWHGNFDDQALEQFLRFGEGMVKERGPALRCLGVVSPVWPAPRFEDRERIREALQFLDEYCDAFSLVGADHNYRLAEQILRGLGFLQQARYPFGSFNNVTDGAKWLVARERPRPDASQTRTLSLLQAVQAVAKTQANEPTAPRNAQPEVVCHGQESSLAAYSFGRLLITSWQGPVTQAAVQFLIRVSDALRAEQGAPLAHLSVVEPESPRPRFAERQRLLDIARCTKRNTGSFSFLARTSNQRLAEQIMRGMGFLVRSSLQLYSAKNEADAAQWLVQHAVRTGMPLLVDEAGVLDLLEKARRLHANAC